MTYIDNVSIHGNDDPRPALTITDAVGKVFDNIDISESTIDSRVVITGVRVLNDITLRHTQAVNIGMYRPKPFGNITISDCVVHQIDIKYCIAPINIWWSESHFTPKTISLYETEGRTSICAARTDYKQKCDLSIQCCTNFKIIAGAFINASITHSNLSECDLCNFRPVQVTSLCGTIGDGQYIKNVVCDDLVISYTSEQAWFLTHDRSIMVPIHDDNAMDSLVRMGLDTLNHWDYVLDHPAKPFGTYL